MGRIRNLIAMIYEKINNDYKRKELTVQGVKILADKNMHKPGKANLYFADFIKEHIKSTDVVLDVGTGCGVLAILLSKLAKKIVGVEINEKAVAFARKNVLLNNIENIEIRQSDMFQNIKEGEKFDLIIMNPPAFNFSTKKISDCSYIDTEYRMIDSFFKNVNLYTKQNSKIIIFYPQIWSSILERFIKKYGFKFNILARKKNLLYKHMLIYQITK